jgi:hypothetical protein
MYQLEYLQTEQTENPIQIVLSNRKLSSNIILKEC